MSNLAESLRAAVEQRRLAQILETWAAVKAVVDSFVEEASTPFPHCREEGGGLELAEGGDPKFLFSPDLAVHKWAPGVAEGAWEAEAKWVFGWIESFSSLSVEWDEKARRIVLSVPAAAPPPAPPAAAPPPAPPKGPPSPPPGAGAPQ
jgi:hypothetical protein